MLVDGFGRHISYVRISVTDRCDFRCVYCMAENMVFLPKKDLLTLEELERLSDAFIATGVRKIRLTGGEPLVRRDVMSLIKALGQRIGDAPGTLGELTITTNGSQLERFAEGLHAAGVRRINVSLDTLQPGRFEAITRWGKYDKVMAGIAAAKAAGLHVKINAVALKGVNEDEYDQMIAWCGAEGFDLTLIETMPLGEIDEDRTDQYLPLSLVRARLEQALAAHRPAGFDRRAGALCPDRGNRRPARLHHADDPQFLRILQPRPRHLHRHHVHVPRPGGRHRPPRPAPRLGGQRPPARRHPQGHRPQAQRPRLHHRPPPPGTRSRPPHERHRRLNGLKQRPTWGRKAREERGK